MRAFLIALALIASGGSAAAADLTVSLTTLAGAPVRDAVVSFRPAVKQTPPVGGRYEMVQEGIQFHPFVLIVPVGAVVTFPNHDKVRHHVYSFSSPKRFELKLYGREEARTVTFDKPGVVAIGCNIHDRMSAFIYVADTPFTARSDAGGRAVLSGLPAGGGVLTVWHPYLRAPRNETTRALASGGGSQAFRLDLRAAPAAMGAH